MKRKVIIEFDVPDDKNPKGFIRVIKDADAVLIDDQQMMDELVKLKRKMFGLAE